MATKAKTGFGSFLIGCVVLMLLLGLLKPAFGADTNLPPDTTMPGAQDLLRSYLQIQAQLHDTQLALEKIRQESLAATASNSVAMEERMKLLEIALANDRVDQLNRVARMDKTILVAAGTFALIGLLMLLVSAFLQWTALNRLAGAAAKLSNARSPQALMPSDSMPALEQSNIQFLGLMERLEQRLHELEASVKPSEPHANGNSTNGLKSSSREILPPAEPDKTDAIDVLLNKSQALLKTAQPQAALECLDEALALEPGNADALVKKGAVLERLQRTDEAIECYDDAIAKDSSLVVAYLYKAGLLRRMERHSEALACYEQALKPGKVAAEA